MKKERVRSFFIWLKSYQLVTGFDLHHVDCRRMHESFNFSVRKLAVNWKAILSAKGYSMVANGNSEVAIESSIVAEVNSNLASTTFIVANVSSIVANGSSIVADETFIVADGGSIVANATFINAQGHSMLATALFIVAKSRV